MIHKWATIVTDGDTETQDEGKPKMLNKAKVLRGYTLHSLDGEIGKIQEFYFDDQYWTIRYLVGDTGNWLTGKQVLISPYALTAVSQDKATHRYRFDQETD